VPVVSLDANVARRIDFLPRWGQVLIHVYGPGTVYVAGRKETLEMAGPGGQQQGIPWTAANSPNRFPWIGELWAFASVAGTMVDFEVPVLGAEV
jgi:hypothetical protein